MEPVSPSSFSLRVVILTGLACGLALVVAVMLLVGKLPDQPAVMPAQPAPAALSSKAIAASAVPVETPHASVTSQPADPKVLEGEVRQAMEQWAAAWSRRDVKAYLACYASSFDTPGGMARAAWEAQRRSRISRPRVVEVILKQVQVKLQGDAAATVRLVQNYRADNYREKGTRKELRLRHEEGHWRIVSEKEL
jgi:ketosteroid isomerase-like protein